MMKGIELSKQEMEAARPGEAITVGAVMAVMVIAIVAVVAYKLFTSDKGTTKLPGGYAFEWK